MREMTRNKYREHMQKCVSRAYDPKDPYSFGDYKKEDEDIEIIPLDLSRFPKVKAETTKWINSLFTEEDTDRNGNYMLRSFTQIPSKEAEVLNLTMRYPNGCSWYGYNDEEQFIYTYCEGDTTLTILPDIETYEKEKQSTIDWYRKEYGA